MIFYFTGTGNSLRAARALARENERLIDMAEALRTGKNLYAPAPDESVGFVLPTYFYGVPEPVRTFLSRLGLKATHHRYVYLLLTCGGSTGAADLQFARLLQNRGYHLSARYAVRMPDNFMPQYRAMRPGTAEKQLREAEPHLRSVRAMVERRVIGDQNPVKGAFPRLFTMLAYPFYARYRQTKAFRASEACADCGLCARSCPVNAIEMRNNKPFWQASECAACLKCLNSCPKQAISHGNPKPHGGQYNPFERENETPSP